LVYKGIGTEPSWQLFGGHPSETARALRHPAEEIEQTNKETNKTWMEEECSVKKWIGEYFLVKTTNLARCLFLREQLSKIVIRKEKTFDAKKCCQI
jgi:hypothetical protein